VHALEKVCAETEIDTTCPALPSKIAKALLPAVETPRLEALPPTVTRVVDATSATVPMRGTNKSCALTALPSFVVTVTRPEVAVSGTVITKVDELALVIATIWPAMETRFFATVVPNPVPLRVTLAPPSTNDGVKLVMVGAFGEPATTKFELLVAVPLLSTTVTSPVVAPVGTCTVSVFAVAPSTVAETPLNVTVLFAGVVLNPLP